MAGREQVIAALKAAYVQGRLTKSLLENSGGCRLSGGGLAGWRARRRVMMMIMAQ